MNKSNFTSEQNNFIKKNYSSKGTYYCSEYLKLDPIKVNKRANHMGLKLNSDIKSKTVSEHSHKIKNIQKEKEFKIFKNNLFDPNILYFLGFLWADGYIDKNNKVNCKNRISIKMNYKDGLEILKVIKRLPFTFVAKKLENVKRYDKPTKNILDLRIINKFLHKFLTQYNYKNKSKDIPTILSIIPNDLKYYWWRGYFDGDGCFFRAKDGRGNYVSICSTYEQDWSFIKELENNLNIKFKINKRKGKNSKHSVIFLQNIEFIHEFGNYIYKNYQNDKIGFKRKYEKFKTIYHRSRIFLPPQKPNNITNLIAIYKNKNTYCSKVIKDRIEYAFYSNDINKSIEMSDRIILHLFNNNYKLNKPELENYYKELNIKESIITLIKIRNLNKS